MNLGQIRSQVETYLLNTSTDTASLSWSVSEINSYINEACLYTQQVTLWQEDWDNLLCTASTSTYTGPSRAYQFRRVTWDRSFLAQTNEYELDRDVPNWRSSPVNNPFRFYFPQMAQQYQLVPYPTPSQNGISYSFSAEVGTVIEAHEASSGDGSWTFSQETGIVIAGPNVVNSALLVYRPDRVNNPFVSAETGELIGYSLDELNIGLAYACLPDTLAQDTDTPQLPMQCHLGLVFYALMQCFQREGEFQDLTLAQNWFTAYGDWMEAVLENKARWWPTRVKSLEPFEEGSLFSQRLNAIGYPLQIELNPSY